MGLQSLKIGLDVAYVLQYGGPIGSEEDGFSSLSLLLSPSFKSCFCYVVKETEMGLCS